MLRTHVRSNRRNILAGVNKTALLEYIWAEQASGCRVVRAAGVQSEMELAFAGLHQLLAPMLDRRERLPLRRRCAADCIRRESRVGAGRGGRRMSAQPSRLAAG